MELTYMQKVRIFHIVLGLFLLYGTIPMLKKEKKQPPQWWFVVLTILALGAVSYHGYRLYQSYQQ